MNIGSVIAIAIAFAVAFIVVAWVVFFNKSDTDQK